MTPNKFHVAVMGPGGAFRECTLFCYYGLKSLGYTTSYGDFYLDPDAINVVIGANSSNWQTISAQAKHIIIYNLEQVSPEVPWFNLSYFRQLLHTQVWDYNLRNIELLQAAGVPNISHVPLGYSPEMSEIPLPSHQEGSLVEDFTEQAPIADLQDIDVLFYGSISPRRKRTLDAIRARGLNVASTETGQMLGDERTKLIARAKVVLNIHYYETVGIFEIVRVSYLLANHKAVVSELSPHTDIEPDIKEAIISGSLDELPELCWQLVQDHTRRKEVEQRGFEIFARRKAVEILKPAVDHYLATRDLTLSFIPPAIPRTLQIGAGPQWRFDLCNIDSRADFSPDFIIDLNQPIPFDAVLNSFRFGQTSIPRNYFHKIIAKNVFQCSENLVQALTNCLDLLVDGGTLELEVPHDLSYGAWALAETKRTFNERTWGNLLNFWWQYGWQTHRLEPVNLRFIVANDVGFKALEEHENNWDTVLKIPRTVDALGVVLRKRALTSEELEQLPVRQFLS